MVQMEAVQTVMPTKPTDPRKSFRVIVPQDLSLTTLLHRRFHVVLCYKKAWDEDSGRLMAGWIKESLGRALVEEPLLAGRLRRRSEEESDHGDLHIVSNDSGVRLIEVRMNDMKLDDYVGLMEKKRTLEVDESISELVFWEDLWEQQPQFSPLFYVQVTNFSCGGYSIGISCSLLLADPFALTGFLNTWSNLHNTIVSSNAHKIPTFYHPKLGKPGLSSQTPPTTSSNTCKAAAQTLLFRIPSSNILDNFNEINIYENLAGLCIDEAENVVGRKMASKFSLFVVKPCGDVEMEICSREGISGKIDINGKLSCWNIWDDDELKLDKICFNEGNQAVHVSCWINSIVDEDFVMIIASDGLGSTSGMKIMVTFA